MPCPTLRPHAPATHGSTPGPAAPALPGTTADQRRIDSQSLFEGRVAIEIEHLAQVYRLRQTSLGKLILTK